MNKIITGLYVGDQADGNNFFLSQNPHVIIDLTGWAFDLDQNKDNIEYVIKVCKIIQKCLEGDIPCLVHCHAGIDRAPFMAAAFLYIFRPYNLYDAYNLVKKNRPQTIIHDDWLKGFIEYMTEDLSIKGE